MYESVCAFRCVCVCEFMAASVTNSISTPTNSRMLKELTCGEQQHSFDRCMQNETVERATKHKKQQKINCQAKNI